MGDLAHDGIVGPLHPANVDSYIPGCDEDQLTPREEEISQLRDLIRRIEADVAGLTEQDQALIADAVTVIRKTRQLVNLGMPAVRPAAKTG
jgi:hypothetical protein